jgi:hypothetical protein
MILFCDKLQCRVENNSMRTLPLPIQVHAMRKVLKPSNQSPSHGSISVIIQISKAGLDMSVIKPCDLPAIAWRVYRALESIAVACR